MQTGHTRKSARVLVIAAVLVSLALPVHAGATRYDSTRAGHPLRVAAYILHPFGVILDTLIFHPAWWVGQHEPMRTLFGVESMDDDAIDVHAANVVAPLPEPGPDSVDPADPVPD